MANTLMQFTIDISETFGFQHTPGVRMTTSYVQLMKQIAALSRDAEKLKRKEVESVIGRIKEAIDIYGLTAADLGLTNGVDKEKSKRSAAKGQTGVRPVKFRDSEGNTWGGRGPRPAWLRDAVAAGKAIDDFAV
jgi:DNA-binding protein H-NS